MCNIKAIPVLAIALLLAVSGVAQADQKKKGSAGDKKQEYMRYDLNEATVSSYSKPTGNGSSNAATKGDPAKGMPTGKRM